MVSNVPYMLSIITQANESHSVRNSRSHLWRIGLGFERVPATVMLQCGAVDTAQAVVANSIRC